MPAEIADETFNLSYFRDVLKDIAVFYGVYFLTAAITFLLHRVAVKYGSSFWAAEAYIDVGFSVMGALSLTLPIIPFMAAFIVAFGRSPPKQFSHVVLSVIAVYGLSFVLEPWKGLGESALMLAVYITAALYCWSASKVWWRPESSENAKLNRSGKIKIIMKGILWFCVFLFALGLLILLYLFGASYLWLESQKLSMEDVIALPEGMGE